MAGPPASRQRAVIPLEYRLRGTVRLEPASDGAWLVVCETPLSVLRVNEAAARLLKHARRGDSVAGLATVAGVGEERTIALCERFRRRGILEVRRAPADAGFTPSVTVVVPTRDRVGDLDECLAALGTLDYPRDRLQVIVIDDSSVNRGAVSEVALDRGALLLVNDRNRGPSFSRNRGAREAEGEILAFIDSDCVCSQGWLRDLTSLFAWERVGAVGGRTLGYYSRSRLDRYEEVSSPLDMGSHFRLESQGADTFYVPTCNLLVRRTLFLDLGGLREDLRTGEDVDFCWRLRARGHCLVYVPEGIIRHKHRGALVPLLRQRMGYGGSEAKLYSLHPDKRKHFPWEPAPLATAALVSAAVIWRGPVLVAAAAAPVLWDGFRRAQHLRRAEVEVAPERVWSSVARGHLSLLYFAYFHLVRYYLGPLVAAGLVFRGAHRLAALALVYASAVEYLTKRPRLGFLAYLGYYLAEHAAYQAGVVAGCLRQGSFCSYRVALRRGKLCTTRNAPSRLPPAATTGSRPRLSREPQAPCLEARRLR